jgi:ketosteroid isomerase-like protein
MSQENVEIVRRFSEAGGRYLEAYWTNPRSGVAALEAGELDPEAKEVLAYLHHELEFNAVGSAIVGGTIRGHLGWLRFWDEFLAASEDLRRGTVLELEDLGEDQVLAVLDFTFTGKGSGIELNPSFAYLVTLRDGSIVRIDAFRDRNEAFEAAGLAR